MSRRTSGAVAALLALLVVAGLLPAAGAAPVVDPASGSAGTAGPAQAGGTCDFRALYDRTVDSVVQVQTTTGIGSGFVVRRAGNGTVVVVTNQHVVPRTRSVDVAFARGDVRPGTVVGADALSDLAVVRVADAPAYATRLSLADSMPDPGQPVAAFGSPFGLEGTITQGIVSGTNRSMPSGFDYPIPATVQTDAAINPGNSGGPLVACDGTVLGVNRAGVPALRGENTGFAVSAALARRVVPALVADGSYEHPFLGVRTVDLDRPLRMANELNATGGAYVLAVQPGGPADGVLRPARSSRTIDGVTGVPVGGDVVVAVDGVPVATEEAFRRYLALETRPGDRIELVVLRDGDRETANATVGGRTQEG